ncbi:tRNA (adenosine(37)-N6)-threonylcarbamoyltransferase complex dimerization subunit type 1 TsaB [Lysobacter korlensis]|uniref:tRNA threonylcarbamoyladenosine biosynthesis protein TsaB n=1 Tax=Lysobacter korlensis TaxID=553636 RepID=A0ABV6RMM5_9GAMM
MKLLAFETSTEACSVALWLDGEVRERFELAPRRHAEVALPWTTTLLDEAGVKRSQIDAIAVGRGPGAFTGVRLAIALAQGIALALDRPVVPVSTLAALAMQGRGGTSGGAHVVAAIDARMSETYVGMFAPDGEGMRAIGDEWLGPPADFKMPGRVGEWSGVGTGFAALDGVLSRRLESALVAIDPMALPHAADVALLASIDFASGKALAPEHVEPAYLRNNVALTLEQQRAARLNR